MSTSVCYRCDKTGHFAIECPDGRNSSTLCYRCDRAGQLARECPERDGDEDSGNGGDRDRRDTRDREYVCGHGGGLKCYKCNRFGHFARDCREEEDCCYRCHGTGEESSLIYRSLWKKSQDCSDTPTEHREGSELGWRDGGPANAKEGWGEKKDETLIKSNLGDQNSNVVRKEKAPGSVVMIYNLDPKFMDCDRLFNLLSPYAQVQSIKFLKVSDFRKAFVELNSKEGAQRVMKYIKEENLFGKRIRIEPSSKLRVTEFNPSQLPPLPNGTKAFKDYSEASRKNSMDYLRASMYPPARTIYFCKTPKMSDEDFKDIFEKRKAPVPYKIMWFPSGGMGCLQFKTKEEALKAICIANLVQAKNGRRIHLAFTFERKDSDFYSKK